MEEQKKCTNWGGSRSGAGRKIEGTSKKVTVGMTLTPEAKEKLFREAAAKGITASQLVEQLINAL